METIKQNFEFTKGDTFAFALQFAELGQSFETVYLTCRDGQSIDDNMMFKLSLNDGIEEEINTIENEDETTTTIYNYKFRIAPEKTKNLESGVYYYDIQISANGDIYTIYKGKIKLTWEVTKEGEII